MSVAVTLMRMFVKVQRFAVSGVFAAVTLVALALPQPADAAIPADSQPENPDRDPVDGPSVVAQLDTVQPATLRSDTKKFTLSGTVTNNGDETLENVQVLPRWDLNPVESRAEIREVVADPEAHSGLRYEPGEFLDELAPGQSKTFELDFTGDEVASIGFYAPGVYVMGVDVNATPSDGDRILQLDNDRTFVTWLPDGIKLPEVPVSMLWPVTAQPSLMLDGTHFDDSMAERIGDGGALGSLVDAAAAYSDAPLTWLVDPDVLTTTQDMADGYRLRDGETEGAGAEDAQAWQDAFAAATTDADLNWLPAAHPDLSAFAESEPKLTNRLAAAAVESTRLYAAESDLTPGSTIAWSAGPTVHPKAMAALAKTAPDTTLLPASAIKVSDTAHSSISTIGTESGDLDVTATDSGLAAAIRDFTSSVNKGDGETTSIDFAQRWRAETALAAFEALETGEDPQPLVAAPPQNWSPTRETADAVIEAWTTTRWVKATALANLPEPDERPTAELADYRAGSALSADNVDEVDALRDESEAFVSLLADKADVAERLDATLLRASSTGWRRNSEAGLEYAARNVQDLQRELGNVQVIVRQDVTLTSSAGKFPLTVENGLDEAVELGLQVQSSNPDRLAITGVPEAFTVQPGERQTVAVNAQAKTNGKVPIEVQLTNREGIPIGTAVQSNVNATDYGTVGWVIVGAAGVLLGAGLARRVLKGKTSRRNGESPGGPDVDDDRIDHAQHEQPQTQEDGARARPSEVTR